MDSFSGIPKEMIEIEINKWLLEIDRQILRKVNKYFNELFPFIEIDFDEIDLELVHVQRYKKLLSIFTLSNIVHWGRVECLKYIIDPKGDGSRKGGCKWNWKIMDLIAQNGHLECLKFAHSQCCQWYSSTTTKAATGGHIECLKYLHENGCPWNWKTLYYAAQYGHLECLKYAHENGCPGDSNILLCAHTGCNIDCINYICEIIFVKK